MPQCCADSRRRRQERTDNCGRPATRRTVRPGLPQWSRRTASRFGTMLTTSVRRLTPSCGAPAGCLARPPSGGPRERGEGQDTWAHVALRRLRRQYPTPSVGKLGLALTPHPDTSPSRQPQPPRYSTPMEDPQTRPVNQHTPAPWRCHARTVRIDDHVRFRP